MPYNAIRIGASVEKTTIDFSSLESLKETSGFRRLYTIHTAETKKMSDLLGFHVGGFCDDHGAGGTDLAASTAGYPDLPSDLILCRMDDRYDFLPLDADELESLYAYLTTGKIVPIGIESGIAEFFEKHGIDPILPAFPIDPKPLFFNEYPKVIVLSYNELDAKTDKMMEEYGAALFHFADRIINEMRKRGETNMDPGETYYLENCRGNGRFYCIIQAIESAEEEPVVDKIIQLITNNSPAPSPQPQDKDPDIGDPDHKDGFIVELNVNVDWPNSLEIRHYESNDVFVDVHGSDSNEEVPFFQDHIAFLSVDEGKGTAFVGIKGMSTKVTLSLNRPFEWDVDTDTPQGHCVGKACLTLRKACLAKDTGIPGFIRIHHQEIAHGETIIDGEAVLEPISSNIADSPMVEARDGEVYGIFLLDVVRDFCVLYHFSQEDPEQKNRFLLLRFGETLTRVVATPNGKRITTFEYLLSRKRTPMA